MNIIAQILGLFGIAANVIGIQLKKKRHILMSLILVNIIFAISFILLKSYSGAVIALFAGIQTYIKYVYDDKNKKLPIYFIALFLIVPLIFGLTVYKSYIDILPLICSITYTLIILQKDEKELRLLSFFNILIWTIYDFYIGFYTAAVNDVLLTLSILIAIFRYDFIGYKILLKKLEDTSINGVVDFIDGSIEKLDNGIFVYNKTIEDIYWNYMAYMNVKTKEEFDKAWKINKQTMLDKNRKPALYILPSSKLLKTYKKVLPDYMKIESSEIWMIFDDYKNIKNIADSKINITINRKPKVNDFIDTFMKSYASTSETDPYGELPDYYRKVVRDSFKQDSNRTYYLAYSNNVPISTTITVENKDVALICFVGTIPEYRNKGVCKHLMREVLNDLKKKKIKTVYLQTEEGFIPEKLYSSIGFKTFCKALIVTEKE